MYFIPLCYQTLLNGRGDERDTHVPSYNPLYSTCMTRVPGHQNHRGSSLFLRGLEQISTLP